MGDAAVADVPKFASDAVRGGDAAATAAAADPTEYLSSRARLIPSRLVLPGSLQKLGVQADSRRGPENFECLAHPHYWVPQHHHGPELDAAMNAQDCALRLALRPVPARAMIDVVAPPREPLPQPPTNV